MPGYLKTPQPIPNHLMINSLPFALNIGLVWASGADNKDMYKDKSLTLDSLMPIFSDWLSDHLICLHSLQVGVDSPQIEPWLDTSGVFDWSDSLGSFLDTAHLISQLDLVITVDTAVAHVSGALDKPTWLLLQHNADFRWLRGRSDSPWYNSFSIFRQHSLGDWNSAINDVHERLTQLLGS